MKKSLKKLEEKKLFQEYVFIKSDLEYKKSIVDEFHEEFMKKAKEILGPEYQEKNQEDINNSLVENESPQNKENLNIKKLYREISKKTHPDKDPEGIYSDIFAESAIAYEKNDIFRIYEICDKLNIQYEIGEEEISMMKSEIDLKKKEIQIIEKSYIYMWYSYDSQKIKDILVSQFVKNVLQKRES